MLDRAMLKGEAKKQIKGNIGILFVCILVAGIVTGVSSIVSWLVAPAILMGMVMIFIGVSNGKKPEIGDVFGGFSIFGKAWWLTILIGFFTSLWSMLFVIPGIIKGLSYSMAPFILAENPTMTAREALNESKKITNGAKMDLFVLCLSFIGWMLLGTITCGIAYIYVLPYMSTTMANTYKSLKDNK